MKVFFGCLLLIYSMMVNAGDDSTMNINVKDPGFVVTLPANPTTGFQWSVVQYDHNLLKLSGSNYEKPNSNLIGAGGQMHFTFKLEKGKKFPESTQLKFKYSRQWESKGATMKTVTVNFIKD